MNVGFYLLIFHHTPLIGPDSGWGKYEFFVFLATTWLINSLVQTFFMTNADEFSELIRTGKLDFALLKPIDTQFLISFQKMDWSALSTFVGGDRPAGRGALASAGPAGRSGDDHAVDDRCCTWSTCCAAWRSCTA